MCARSRTTTTWFHCVIVLPVVHMCLCLSQVDGLPEAIFVVIGFEVVVAVGVAVGVAEGSWKARQLEKKNKYNISTTKKDCKLDIAPGIHVALISGESSRSSTRNLPVELPFSQISAKERLQSWSIKVKN